MSAQTDALYDYFVASGLLTTYKIQFDYWDESVDDAEQRYFIIQQNGGGKAEPWFVQPSYRIVVIGKQREGRLGIADFAGEVSQGIIEYVRKNSSTDCHALIEAINSPVSGTTKENRPWYQFNLRTFTRR